MGKSVLTSRDAAPPDAAGIASSEWAAFPRDREGLRCEGVSLSLIAREAGTPAFVYSAGAIRHQYGKLRAALNGTDARLHYSVKANSNSAILSLLR